MKTLNKYILIVSALVALTACESYKNRQFRSNSVLFNLQLDNDGSQATSRASQTTTANINNFGVFAYYDEDGVFDNSSSHDFMDNITVNRDGDNWKYNPTKY